jgi:mitogen-activated protein kinase 1/3
MKELQDLEKSFFPSLLNVIASSDFNDIFLVMKVE